MNNQLNPLSRIILAFSAIILIGSFFVPLWQILMWAPQYPEGLSMKIWIDNISGNVRVINALNHYIGMRNIEIGMFPEFNYMKYIVGVIIGIGLISVLINRRWSLLLFLGVLLATGIAALVDFYLWGYDYGHNLNPEAPIKIPGLSYQPPVIGTKKLLNFVAFSGPDIGGWLFIISGLMVVGLLGLEFFYFGRNKKQMR